VEAKLTIQQSALGYILRQCRANLGYSQTSGEPASFKTIFEGGRWPGCPDKRSGAHHHRGAAVARWFDMVELPAFNEHEVTLLVSSVEQSLQHLRDANERVGGNDSELLAYGERYSIILQKLHAVLKRA
jgi:hypothetical protein